MGTAEDLGFLGATRLETARGLILRKFVAKLLVTMLPGFVEVKRHYQANYRRDFLNLSLAFARPLHCQR